jgi:hypothetical protein
MKGIQKKFKSPLFCFHGKSGKVCPTDSDFVPQTKLGRHIVFAPFLIITFVLLFFFFLSPKVYPTHFSATTFVSMAKAAKFVQPIPILLAYLIPLDVDVFPIKFHQFLFDE